MELNDMKELFSTGDVAEITSLSSDNIGSWCEKGIIRPIDDPGGHGRHRRFTFMQVVGISFGARRRREGAHLRFVTEVIAFVGALPEEKLLAEFKVKRSHLTPFRHPVQLSRPWRGADPNEFNLEQVYYDVVKKAKKLAARPAGRPRGLKFPQGYGAGKKAGNRTNLEVAKR